ncbi:hypothetical protein SETIT_3G361400v2 [Setaria italica]|nr:hypothetical protein SETIT_3G361400v2 [Setaria italica]
MLRGIKATPTSGTTQTINIDKTEFVHARRTDLCSMTTPLLVQTTAIHRTPGAPDERKSR